MEGAAMDELKSQVNGHTVPGDGTFCEPEFMERSSTGVLRR